MEGGAGGGGDLGDGRGFEGRKGGAGGALRRWGCYIFFGGGGVDLFRFNWGIVYVGGVGL